MSKSISPLRYPGGKAKVYKQIVDLLEKNNKIETTYIEPFAGGCGLALMLLKNNIVSNLILNDIDKSIYCFWKSVLKYNSELCQMVDSATLTLEEREIQKSIQNNKEKIDMRKKEDVLKLGFSTFYLNRVNRSGIIKAGVIGGINQDGNYKMDCRFNKKDLVEKIQEIYKYKDKIKFYNLDVLDFLKRIKNKDNFIFFDPPYYNKGKDLYVNFYKHDDHLNLANKISKLRNDWIVTYDNTDEIKNMYSQFRQKEFDITYTLENKRKAKEIIIFSNTLENIL
ncbi:DNA adenine methylase [Fusobacterium mortiferum]|uniref:DNA adenine methylase n=1 Tax=Fusobacterium mortiferum TaxID=850 RepID=UPI001F221306|nr:DNA adenine methylase [Fusobacterium mortiferum]MCF2628976.1 DNA adenine methylase [Fusobacterium mortiferum]